MTYLDPLAARIRDQVGPGVGIPDEADHLFALYALLARAKGPTVTAGDVHDAWVVWMQTRGLKHPAMIPFEELDEATQLQDEPFVAAIREALAEESAG